MLVIAGPCVIESEAHAIETALEVRDIASRAAKEACDDGRGVGEPCSDRPSVASQRSRRVRKP